MTTADQALAARDTAQPAREAAPAARPEAGDAFGAAFATARMPMVITDARRPDNPIVHANDAFLQLTGYTRDEVLGRNCRFLQGRDTDAGTVERLRQALDRGEDVSVEILNYRKDGTPFWNALHVSPVRDGAGAVRHFFGSQHDVSAKKRLERDLQDANARLEREVERRTRDLQEALKAKEILLHEVDHRVKNNLQLVGSLLAVQARRIPDPTVRDSLQRAVERVTALSAVHRRLYEAAALDRFDLAAFARQLAEDLAAASGRGDVALELDLDPLEVRSVKAAPLGLILNELLVNALRHAFPGERGGTIRVALRHADGRFSLTVEDDGVGCRTLPPQGGFGSTLVRSLARQLGAELAWQAAEPGIRARLALPVNGGGNHGTA
jgi:PAS domain S-box-containing protein